MSHRPSSILIHIDNRQTGTSITEDPLKAAVQTVLRGEGIMAGEVNIAVVDNQQIHAANRKFLQHDEPTDVISFSLAETGEPLEGDLMVSAEMASLRAPEYGWRPLDELVLYVIHGTLHLVGYDDQDEASRAVMRAKEEEYMQAMKLSPFDSDSVSDGARAANPPSRNPLS